MVVVDMHACYLLRLLLPSFFMTCGCQHVVCSCHACHLLRHLEGEEGRALEVLLDQEVEDSAELKPAGPAEEQEIHPFPGQPGLPGKSSPPSVAATPSMGDSEELPTSKSHKRQWNLLERVANGPRAAAHPELAKMWSGSTDDKRRALQSFLRNDENLAATESAIVVKRRKVDAMNHRRQWLTIRQMHEKKVLGVS